MILNFKLELVIPIPIAVACNSPKLVWCSSLKLILLKVEMPVVAFTLPNKVPVTFPFTLALRLPVIFKSPPAVIEPDIFAEPKTWSCSCGTVIPIPRDPPIPVRVISLALFNPLCQWKSPSTALALSALKW